MTMAATHNQTVRRLGDVLTKSDDWIDLDPVETYTEVSVRLWGKGVVARGRRIGSEIGGNRRLRVSPGEFILSRIDARNGAFGLIPSELAGAVVSNDFPTFRTSGDSLLIEYMGWVSRTREFIKQCRAVSEGTTNRVRLNETRFLQIEIPLPPLEEQRRIVAKIEHFAAKIDEAHGLQRRTTQESAVLLSAARHMCVELLRETHDDVTLGTVCNKITDGPHVSPTYVEGGVAFISVRNISESGLDFSSAKYVSLEDHHAYSKKANVERGDVLYTKGGTTGVARRVDTDRPFSIWVHVALLKLKRERADAAFVEHMLNSPTSKEQAEGYTRGSSNRDLGLTRMCNIVFPLPPLDEQRRIVAYLDSVQAKVDRLKALQQKTAIELDALLPSILDKAFKGEL